MANRRRGEVAATVGGRSYTLCLTLGALAELESAFAAEDLSDLARRFGSGRLSARDLVRLLGAGLRGGGHPIGDGEVETWPAAELFGLAAAASDLLRATFGDPQPGDAPPDPPVPQES